MELYIIYRKEEKYSNTYMLPLKKDQQKHISQKLDHIHKLFGIRKCSIRYRFTA